MGELEFNRLYDREVVAYMKNERNKKNRLIEKERVERILEGFGIEYSYTDWDFRVFLPAGSELIDKLERKLQYPFTRILKSLEPDEDNNITMHIIV